MPFFKSTSTQAAQLIGYAIAMTWATWLWLAMGWTVGAAGAAIVAWALLADTLRPAEPAQGAKVCDRALWFERFDDPFGVRFKSGALSGGVATPHLGLRSTPGYCR